MAETAFTPVLRAHERRVCRVLEGRGHAGLGEALSRLGGTRLDGRYRLEVLYAVGGEGVVYVARDLTDPSARIVAKLPLLPFHRPLELSSNFLRRRREQLREEARNLAASSSRFLPRFLGLREIVNPLLDTARGGEFTQLEPVLLMEWMPGFDLDVWLARVHRSDVPVPLLRRNLDRVAVVLLQALVDLEDHGFHYADLRPGNLRMMGRPERRIRLLDAGSLVEHGDESGRFPNVPAYLPPALFRRKQGTGDVIVPSAATQAVMAGRTLFEVATGRVPVPGEEPDRALLRDSHVSAPVADVIDGLITGSFHDVRPALRYLERRAVKRIPIPKDRHAPISGPVVLGTAAPVADGPAHVPAEPAAPAVRRPQPVPAPRPVLASRPEAIPAIDHPMGLVQQPQARHPAPAHPSHQHPPQAHPHAHVPTLHEVLPAAVLAAAQRSGDVLPPPRKRGFWRRLFGLR